MNAFIYFTLSILCLAMVGRITESHTDEWPGYKVFFETLFFFVLGWIWMGFYFAELF